MKKETNNLRIKQKRRIVKLFKAASKYYVQKNVYNRYWFILNSGNLDKLWTRVEYRETVLAPAMKSLRKSFWYNNVRLNKVSITIAK